MESLREPMLSNNAGNNPKTSMNTSGSNSNSNSQGLTVRLAIRQIAVVTVSLPLGAFLVCVYLSLRYNFDQATSTHCGVSNYLPSISSAIGEFVPQRYIWRTAVALHSAPRFLIALLYIAFMDRILPRIPAYQVMRKLYTFLNLVEVTALLGLSFVSSKENYDLHKGCFILFMVCSELYMLMSCLLLKDHTRQFVARFEHRAFTIKKQLMLANMFCFVVALYFYYRHNAYCEPGMYTGFAFMEYLIVLTNMGFHMAAYYDFYHYQLTIAEFKSSYCNT